MSSSTDSNGSRRRGEALEGAILDAAWEELNDGGYRGLTLQAVASRAGTSRPVLARRWPSVMALATAALARFVRQHPVVVPDMGNLRDELRALLRGLADRTPPTLLRYIFEMGDDLHEARSNMYQLRADIADPHTVGSILDRAVARGEIDPARLTPRITTLMIDLTIYEEVMTLETISDAGIDEIIDDIFLPLVTARPA
ncbi:TetR/AcrR family transcriptional regulator [Pseudoroseicyclus tamaricis]|uniref:TetR/AcrR family transcriptional regulator n=1 Tax=Pseudoroseicyclus tamaricis TaxID=2705421 RepID=A0A6B2K4B4_9RHOB|nr:TetR/AcrR family transcriptional regulator [Pseudoroseicyclus tamaricis]NDV01516.1 TetR/AcrR family transcriptional regulator [Pseudoroseicyclus tamaricis]